MNNIGIFGSGSWSLALAKVLAEKSEGEEKIHWYFRKKEDIDFFINYKHHPRYLPSLMFSPDKFIFHSEPEALFRSSETVILAIPAAFLHEPLDSVPKALFENKVFFSAVKGIIPSHLLIIGDYLNKVYGVPYSQIGVLTGPCHAEEVAMEKLSYLTVASENENIRNAMANRLRCRYLNTVESDDIFGTELAAVLKNVYAIAAGMCMGLGYGDNFIAVLVSYAIQEMKSFIDRIHPISRDIHASAYVGDLLVTVYSPFSRNRMFGMMIGKGYSVSRARLEMNMVAEGYYSSACVHKICSDLDIKPELAMLVYRVLYEDASASDEIKKILPKLT
ncbi:MAG: glycerol-3-phosphate dehydrogenase [Bacteroidia bacterium]|nr:glycerol-3-phosphate dehydrogenase [Bacteroidia bacterium]